MNVNVQQRQQPQGQQGQGQWQEQQKISPERIMETATGFWKSKTLLTAVEFDVFSAIGNKSVKARDLERQLGFHPRATFDFLDALVAMKFLDREGVGEAAVYKNTPETAAYLDKSSPDYRGSMLEMLNVRLYSTWSRLEEGIRTGMPQNEYRGKELENFNLLYSDEKRLKLFLDAMDAVQADNFAVLAETFDFSKYKKVADIGGGQAKLAITLAQRHPHLKLLNFELPNVSRYAQDAVDKAHVGDRVTIASGDFFKDDFPQADIIAMGNILHDWNLEKKKLLLRKAFDALPKGGVFIAIENVIDDNRRENAFGLLMSLNMLVETGGGFDYSQADFCEWSKEIGFSGCEFIRLAGPASAAVAYK